MSNATEVRNRSFPDVQVWTFASGSAMAFVGTLTVEFELVAGGMVLVAIGVLARFARRR